MRICIQHGGGGNYHFHNSLEKAKKVRSSHRDSSFFREKPFYNFPGGSICSSNRHEFFRRIYNMFFEQTQIFQEGSSKRHVFSRRFYLFVEHTLYLIEQILIFPETLIWFSNTYKFSRKPYLVLEHIRFSRRPLCLEHIRLFQEGSPRRTDISLIDLGSCWNQIQYPPHFYNLLTKSTVETCQIVR